MVSGGLRVGHGGALPLPRLLQVGPFGTGEGALREESVTQKGHVITSHLYHFQDLMTFFPTDHDKQRTRVLEVAFHTDLYHIIFHYFTPDYTMLYYTISYSAIPHFPTLY